MNDEDQLRRKHRKTKPSSKMQALARKVRLWLPLDARLALVGISFTADSGDVEVATAEEAFRKVAEHWVPTCQAKAQDPAAICQVIQANTEHFSNWNLSKAAIPERHTIRLIIKRGRGRNTRTGADGIPYAAWYAAGESAVETIYLSLEACLNGQPLSDDEYIIVTVFVPKDLERELAGGVSCFASDLRPLGMKNTSIKIMCSSIDHSLCPQVQQTASKLQRGFIRGRHFTDNIVELDVVGRVAPLMPTSFLPLMVLFDFSAAFASVSHLWLFEILKAMGAPIGLLNFVHFMYSNTDMYINAFGITRYATRVGAGVVQGCPLS
eukprot:1226564-Karenia_brevis.AAC.1